MKSIGKWWLGSEELSKNEKVIADYLASYKQLSWRAVGGKIFLTNERFIFIPHLFDKLFLGKKLIIKLDEIEDAKIIDEKPIKFATLYVKYFILELKNKTTKKFIVHNIEELLLTVKNIINK